MATPNAETKELVRRVEDAVRNAGRLAVIEAYPAADFVQHETTGHNAHGPDEWRRNVAAVMHAAFPNGSAIEDVIAEGDNVVTRVTVRGTHEGAFVGIPRTGSEIDVDGIHIARIADGQIVEP